MSDRKTLELLERPCWVRVNCDWLRAGLRKLRQILGERRRWDRHLRLVEVANTAAYLMRDHPLWNRQERYGGAEGGAMLHLIVAERLRKASHGLVTFADLLESLQRRVKDCEGDDAFSRAYLAALAEVTPAASIHDFAAEVMHGAFPLPMDHFFAEELQDHGWAVKQIPYETVTQAQAFSDDERERGGPDNLMNHLGRLVGWADSYPAWNFTVDGWEVIRFNNIPEGVVFKETMHLTEIEGYPLPIGAGPAYAEARRCTLEGEPFEIRVQEGNRVFTIHPKVYPRRRALVHPEGFLRVTDDALSEDHPGASAPALEAVSPAADAPRPDGGE